jgi:predicted dehydrogenase
MSTYKAVIVGLGNIAWKFDSDGVNFNSGPLTHAEAFQNSQRVTLVGGTSPDNSDCTLFSKHFGVPVYGNYREMIKETKPDIVSICSPTHLHFEHLHYCLEVGIPMIWLEKPPADNTSQLTKLISKLKATNSSKVLVNYQRRFSEEYGKLKEVISQNLLGDLKAITLTYSRGLLHNGSHNIDLLFYLMGDEIVIDSYVVSKHNSDSPSFILELSGGITVSVIGLELPYHCFDTVFTFEKGRASVLHGGMSTKWEIVAEHEFYPGFYRLIERNEHPLGSGGLYCSLNHALSELIDSFEEKREPLSSLSSAKKSITLIEAILSEI